MMLRTQLAIGGAVLLICAAGGIYFAGRGDEAAVQKPKVELATDNATARGLEAKGEQESSARVDTALRRERSVQEKTNALAIEIRAQPSARLDHAAAARLHAHDRVLCDERPAVCPAPAGGDAPGGR